MTREVRRQTGMALGLLSMGLPLWQMLWGSSATSDSFLTGELFFLAVQVLLLWSVL